MTNHNPDVRPAVADDLPSIPDLAPWIAQRATVRAYEQDEEIPEHEIEEIIDAGRKAPTSGTNQMYSFVWIRDQEKRTRIHKLCDRGTPQVEEAAHFLLTCIDLRRVRQLLEARDRSFALAPMMGLLEGAIDASLAAQAAMIVAESRGYGVCPIGNILNNLPDVARVADLPEAVLPIFGLCIGIPQSNTSHENAPRIPLEAVLHRDGYEDPSSALLDACYDRMNEMYGDSVYGDDSREWQETLERYWGEDGFMNRRESTLCTALEQQGFLGENNPSQNRQ